MVHRLSLRFALFLLLGQTLSGCDLLFIPQIFPPEMDLSNPVIRYGFVLDWTVCDWNFVSGTKTETLAAIPGTKHGIFGSWKSDMGFPPLTQRTGNFRSPI